MKLHQERSYVIALKNAKQVDGMYIGIENSTLSLRDVGDILLVGGQNHPTGENSQGGRYEKLRELGKKLYPNSEEVGNWSAQDTMSADSVPYIGTVRKGDTAYYVATGFCKWGMTSAMVSAMIISDLVGGKENPWDIFNPERMDVIPSGKAVLEGAVQAVKGIYRGLFAKPTTQMMEMKQGHGGIVDYEGEKVGVYKNQDDDLFLVSTKCPHLGCQLEWNPDETSWDCPCHGSRFDYRGRLLDNPAQEDIGYD